MKNLIILNKKEGETPLEALENFRRKNKAYKDVKMTYAGRLDPMASGLLILLAGDATKEKEKYLKLLKEYKFKILFGFATDTYDILGKITNHNILARSRKSVMLSLLKKKIKANLKYFTGKFQQQYPMYSSKTVAGKPLFTYARAGKKVDRVEHKVAVMSLKFLGIRSVSRKKLLENIEKRIAKVQGDFRQKEIIKLWRKKLKGEKEIFYTASFHIKCGSGTYVRAIANDLGKRIKIPSLALSIKRTKIGKYEKP